MAALVVLVHSPLVGPTTWQWVAEELGAAGVRVEVPTLLAAAATGRVDRCIDAAVEQISAGGDEVVLVGHSGAGSLLPTIASRVTRPVGRLVFVDAGVPPDGGEAPLVPDALADHLRSIARHGVLPPWSEWFGRDTLDALVPDPGRRRAIVAEIPRLPVRYLDAVIDQPVGWSAGTTPAYVLLSEVYRPDADGARSRGWPVVELLGNHLDMVNRPRELAEAITSLSHGGDRTRLDR